MPDPRRFDDLFAPFGRVDIRRMFGAEGLFRDRRMFAIIYEERIYFKTSEESRKAFIAEGAEPLFYKFKSGEGVLTSYYELPDRLYDDPEEFAGWARMALQATMNAPSAKKKRGTAGRKRAAKKPAPKRR